MHPDTEIRFINEEIGYGVVATKFIPEGTITWAQDDLDRVLKPREVEKMSRMSKEMVDKFSFRNKAGDFVLCWDLAKYVNHSFHSNCLSSAYGFEIAVRDIHPGEELTDDYGYLNITEPFKAKDEGTERNTVYPDDLLNFHEKWDEQLQKAFSYFLDVEQPLGELLPEETLNHVRSRVRQKLPLDSILNLYYREE